MGRENLAALARACSHKDGTAVTLAFGDGVGPALMEACLKVLHAAEAKLAFDPVVMGAAAVAAGASAGITQAGWDSLRRTKLLYKGPTTTPGGGGAKSLNVTIRKTLGMYANVRPCVSYAPAVPTRHPGMNAIVIREAEEDLHGGVEHRQTDEVTQCLKLITHSGCEKIVRYSFAYAEAHGRRKITCLTLDTLMKITDGLFHRVFNEVSTEYPGIEAEHMLADTGMAKFAAKPEAFDVILAPNLYGDLLGAMAAAMAGAAGMAPSMSVGAHGAMFKTVRGTAEGHVARHDANPSGLLLAGAMLLTHVGQGQTAARVHNAWLRTLEDGVRTADMEGMSVPLDTAGFADAVMARLGQMPQQLAAVSYPDRPVVQPKLKPRQQAVKALVGVDVFVHRVGTLDGLVADIRKGDAAAITLCMVTSRGVKVWPDGFAETGTGDHWRCRFMAPRGMTFTKADLLALLTTLEAAGVDVIKMENLYTFDGEPGYSLGQGQ